MVLILLSTATLCRAQIPALPTGTPPPVPPAPVPPSVGAPPAPQPPPTTTSKPPKISEPVITARTPDGGILTFLGETDVRYRYANRETRGSYIASSRFTVDFRRPDRDETDQKYGARLQLLLETDNRGTSVNHLRASEFYGFYRFLLPGVSARIKVGQFVLPFGLIAVYDTPLQPIQPLYEKSLGLRVDTGVMLEGEYGPYHYAGAITTGNGPNRMERTGNHLISFRLSRSVQTSLGEFEVGGSILSGRGPVTNFNTALPASGTSSAHDFTSLTRFGGDTQYFLGPLTLRGEIVFGGNGDQPVFGYFGEGNYEITRHLTLVAEQKQWNFPVKPQKATTSGAGFNYNVGNGLTFRFLFEYERDVPNPAGTPPDISRRFTLQTKINF